jgi:hypothetical protein
MISRERTDVIPKVQELGLAPPEGHFCWQAEKTVKGGLSTQQSGSSFSKL